MNKLQYLLPNNTVSKHTFSNERKHKILVALINHVYTQTFIGMLSSAFCAGIVFIDLFDFHHGNTRLFLWAGFFVAVTVARIFLAVRFKKSNSSGREIKKWRNLYILGTIFGGMSWGLISIILFPHANMTQQMLIVLMLAGVTAGAIPLSAAIPYAAIGFLFFSILPFIISIALLQNNTYLLFDAALSLYLLYTISLTLRSHQLIENFIILKFENDILLYNLELSNKKFEHAATHDPLTQVANRSLFKTNLEEAIKQAELHGKVLALFYIDLDHFKQANDAYGHRAGDLILTTTIDRLKKYFHKDDNIARLGGDEIAVIVENADNQEHVKIIAREVCDIIAQPIQMKDITLHTTASIGISLYPYNGCDEDTLLQCSDRYMYLAKENGGNNFYVKES